MESRKNIHDEKEHSEKLKQTLDRNQVTYFEYREDDDSHTIEIKHPENKRTTDVDRQHSQDDPKKGMKGDQ